LKLTPFRSGAKFVGAGYSAPSRFALWAAESGAKFLGIIAR
jgi:hypothetical protein